MGDAQQYLQWGEDSVKLAYMAELLSGNHCRGSKIMSKCSGESHKDWTIEQSNKVFWTNESKFEIFVSNRRVYVQWRVGKRPATSCIIPTVKQEGGSNMAWEAFGDCQIGDLHQVKGKLNQTSYHSLLQHHATPSETQLMSQRFVLIQYNSPKYTSKLCQG